MPQYSKTTWLNGNLPAIDDTNLNKIEQGIFDSLRQDGSTTMSAQFVTIAGSAATPAIAPTGDANTGIFFPAADTIAFGEGGLEAMRINSAGNVGIGTISPNDKLEVVGGIRRKQVTAGTTVSPASEIGLQYQFDNTANRSGIYFLNSYNSNGAAWMSFWTSNTSNIFAERMRIDAAGNVGIGTTNPTNKLQIDGVTANTSCINAVANTTTGQSFGIALSAGTNSSDYALNIRNAAQTSQLFHITGAGNVGIGTTSPTTRLHVEEALTGSGGGGIIAATASSNGNAGIGFRTASTDVYSITTLGSAGSQNLRIRDVVNNATRVTLDSSGNVGIGTTSPSVKLQVVDASDAKIQSVRTGGCTVQIEGGGSAGFLKTTTNHNLVIGTNNADSMTLTTAGYLLIGYTSSNGAYPLQVNGQIFATSSTIATSDGRYKKDVVALDGALDIVKALNPVQFSWKDHPVHKFNTDVPTVGFIAQEVEQALADKSYLTSIIKKSECTWETETGEFVEREVTRDVEKQVEREVVTNVTDEDGNWLRDEVSMVTETVIEQVTEIVQEPVKETHTEEFLGIAESNLIAILTKAVKELATEVESLKAQLNK